jgi:uncharacterized protein (DUF1330 family)
VSGACVIGHISVKDAQKWAAYCAQVPATIAPWHGELVFRGRRAAVLGGRHERTDTVVLRFPDLASVDAWFGSAAYQALIPLRMQSAEVDLVSFEG